MQAGRAPSRGVCIARLGHDLHVAFGLDDPPQAVADDLVIVGEDDRDRLGLARPLRLTVIGFLMGTVVAFRTERRKRPPQAATSFL